MSDRKEGAYWVIILGVAIARITVGTTAFGFSYASTASNTDMMFDLYNFVHNATSGAPGYVLCVVGVILGAMWLCSNRGPAIGSVRMPLIILDFAGVIFIIKADSILSSLGYTFP
jgi:hypothetical protein